MYNFDLIDYLYQIDLIECHKEAESSVATVKASQRQAVLFMDLLCDGLGLKNLQMFGQNKPCGDITISKRENVGSGLQVQSLKSF